jgi:hypothetical protein
MKSVIKKKERGFAIFSETKSWDFARGKKKCNELLHVPSLVDGKVTL